MGQYIRLIISIPLFLLMVYYLITRIMIRFLNHIEENQVGAVAALLYVFGLVPVSILAWVVIWILLGGKKW